MIRTKFKYFLNAVFYCVYNKITTFDSYLSKIIYAILSPIAKYLYPKKFRDTFFRLKAGKDKDFNSFRINHNINTAKDIIWILFICYMFFFSSVLYALVTLFYHNTNQFIRLLIISIPILLGYMPIEKSIFPHNQYLYFFNQFEKNDSTWHRKWNRITTLIFCGGLIMFILGFVAMNIIWNL